MPKPGGSDCSRPGSLTTVASDGRVGSDTASFSGTYGPVLPLHSVLSVPVKSDLDGMGVEMELLLTSPRLELATVNQIQRLLLDTDSPLHDYIIKVVHVRSSFYARVLKSHSPRCVEKRGSQYCHVGFLVRRRDPSTGFDPARLFAKV